MYPPNRIRSDGRPRPIRCYKMYSSETGLWYWDAITQAALDDAPFERRGWRGVLSVFFEVRAWEDRVALPCKSYLAVCAPNTSSCLQSLRPEYSRSISQSIFRFKLHIVGVKTTGVYLSTDGKPLFCYSTSCTSRISVFPL